MRNGRILLLAWVLCVVAHTGHATVMNVTQATGPFPDLDQAMIGAQDGDHFTVNGSTGGGTVTIDDCRITGVNGPGADVVGQSVVEGASVTVENLTFDSGGAEVSALAIGGGADVTAINCTFTNAGTSGEVNTVQVGDGIDPAGLRATFCTFSDATLYGLNLESPSSIVDLVSCTAENNANDAIHVSGDGSVLTLNMCNILNNVAEGIKSGANDTVMLVENCYFEGNGSRDWETDSGYVGQIATFRNCMALNGGDRFCRLKGDTGVYLVEDCIIDCNGQSDFIRLGDSHASTLTVRNTCVFNTNGRIIQVDADESQITGIGGDNTVNLSHVTFYNNSRGLENVTPLTFPNTWNIHYCIIAEWANNRTAIDNQHAGSTVTENFNVFADTANANIRNNVAVGAGSIDDVSNPAAITNLFCSTLLGDPDYLKVLTTSAALDIDGSGGLAGGHTLCPATNPVVRGSDGAEFADVGSAVADAGTAAGDSIYVTAAAPGGTVDKNNLTVHGPGPVNTTGLSVQATGVTIQDIHLNGVGVALAGAANSVDVIRTHVDGSSGAGINLNSDGGTMNVTNCSSTNNGGAGIEATADGGVLNVIDTTITGSGDRGIFAQANGQLVSVTDCVIDDSAGEGVLLRGSNSTFTISNSTISNSGGSDVPLSSREHAIRIRDSGNTGIVDNCTVTGNDSGVRQGSGSGNSLTVTDSCIYRNGRGVRADDGGGSGFVTAMHCTIFNHSVGIQNEGSMAGGVNLGNTFNVQYCVIADWDENSMPGDFPGYGFADEVSDAAITENFNLYVDSDVANSARFNVTPGANTVDNSELRNVFCSVYPTNPFFLTVGSNSAANNIDGSGGVAGAKPVACTLDLISSITSEIDNWNLYD